MFGRHHYPITIDHDKIQIELKSEEKAIRYSRTCNDDNLVKDLFIEKAEFFIEPVEPMLLPEKITSNLLIEFENTILIEPKSSITIYLTFPIEIAAYTKHKKEIRRIDVFSLSRKKYTLYGDPEDGVLCKYWKSKVYNSIPKIEPFQEGIMALHIDNPNTEWCEIGQAVFNAFGMKIYYTDELVSLVAKMKVRDGFDAETSFQNKPIKPLMMKSQEMFLSAKLAVGTGKFVMEHGLCNFLNK